LAYAVTISALKRLSFRMNGSPVIKKLPGGSIQAIKPFTNQEAV
jgi:hypothetical protein